MTLESSVLSRLLQTMPTDIVFFNTLGRKLEPLRPLVPGKVSLYTCGPTVYNHVHIGNLRTFVFEDLLRRTLKLLGYRVMHVMNLTDVDDKTIRGAQEKGVSLGDFTEPYVQSFFHDLETLHVEKAELYPRATEHIAEMIRLIEQLFERGVAYVAEDGSVFFRIASDPGYGKLSGFDLESARQGERVANDEYDKEDVRDFVLWKAAKPGEPTWDSPWGPGRPGWHIECSAMSMEYLGTTFDVHCGGVDNMFPHHENEIAQSEMATGQPFVQTWLHAEHLIVDGEKMSKSLGNQYTLRDLMARGVSPRALRYLLLSVHYRQKLNFTFASLEAAAGALRRVDEMRFRLEHAREQEGRPAVLPEAAVRLSDGFRAALADDLNIAAALAAVFNFIKEVNVAIDADRLGEGDKDGVIASLDEVDQVLGLLDPAAWVSDEEEARVQAAVDNAEINRLVQARDEARRGRDFATADRLRDEIAERGILLEDTPHGTRWKRR